MEGIARSFHAVVIPPESLDQPVVVAAARILGLTAFELRQRLAIAGVPRPILTRADEGEVAAAVEALRGVGMPVALISEAEVTAVASSRRQVRDLRREGSALVFVCQGGEEITVEPGQPSLIVRGRRELSYQSGIASEVKTEFNPGQLAAGMHGARTRTRHRAAEKTDLEQFLVVYRGPDDPPLFVAASRCRYDWLGAAKQATHHQSFEQTVRAIVELAPEAWLHTGLSTLRQIPGAQNLGGGDVVSVADLVFFMGGRDSGSEALSSESQAREPAHDQARGPAEPVASRSPGSTSAGAPECTSCGDRISLRDPYYEINGSPWCAFCGERALPTVADLWRRRRAWIALAVTWLVIFVLAVFFFGSQMSVRWGLALGVGLLLWMTLRDWGSSMQVAKVYRGARKTVFASSLISAVWRAYQRRARSP